MPNLKPRWTLGDFAQKNVELKIISGAKCWKKNLLGVSRCPLGSVCTPLADWVGGVFEPPAVMQGGDEAFPPEANNTAFWVGFGAPTKAFGRNKVHFGHATVSVGGSPGCGPPSTAFQSNQPPPPLGTRSWAGLNPGNSMG